MTKRAAHLADSTAAQMAVRKAGSWAASKADLSEIQTAAKTVASTVALWALRSVDRSVDW